MLEEIQKLISQAHIFYHPNQGILVAKSKDTHQGFGLARDILYKVADTKTMLYLSGGRTPKELYKKFAEEEKLEIGAVGLVDERYGGKWHEQSNETMLRDSGLLRYLQMKDISFYPILQSPVRHSGPHGHSERSEESLRNVKDASATPQHDNMREQTAEMYDQKVRELSTLYHKSIGVLGVGMDGHTAGIAGNRHDFKNPMFDDANRHAFVSDFDDQKGMYKERISMTFLGLSMLDLHLVLVFGDDKKEALDKMFSDGSEEDIPSRFFKRPEIAQKTVLITDQNV